MSNDNPSQSNEALQAYWQSACQALAASRPDLPQQPFPEALGFGSNAEHADELGALVVQGIKTATCSLFWEYEAEGSAIPKQGALSLILDGAGLPMCLIETTEVRVLPMDQVEAAFAYEEGEGDRSLEHWRDVHWRFFGPTCDAIGREPAPDMPVVCERFVKLYP